jgi:hypothetical protein
MNPSAADWIPKFLNRFEKPKLINAFKSDEDFYHRLKEVGFIYGVSVQALPNTPISSLRLTMEEFAKINLFHALLFTSLNRNPNTNFEEAIKSIINFYELI